MSDESEERVFFNHYKFDLSEKACFGREKERIGRVTVAFTLDDNIGGSEREVNYAFAYCAPGDNFERKLGRIKSGGRLNSDRYRNTAKVKINPDERTLDQIALYLKQEAKAHMPKKWLV